MKNAINNQLGMLGDMFLWLVANLKQGVIYFIKQGGGNHKIAWVYYQSPFLFSIILFFASQYKTFYIVSDLEEAYKGQLISKCPFGVIALTNIPTKFL